MWAINVQGYKVSVMLKLSIDVQFELLEFWGVGAKTRMLEPVGNVGAYPFEVFRIRGLACWTHICHLLIVWVPVA